MTNSLEGPTSANRILLGALLLTFVLQIPSLRAIFKFLPHPVLMATAFVGVAVTSSYVLLSGRVQGINRLLDTKVLPYFVALFLALVNWIVYPIIDGRKAQGMGSTGDDAMIEPIRALLSGGGLYDVHLYDGAPISPGPGWLLLNAPLTVAGVYFLITPLYLLFTTLLFRSWMTGNVRAAIAMLLLLSAPIVWELMTNGHDLVALGCALAILPLVGFRYAGNTDSKLIGVAVVCGLIATARIVLLPLPVLLAAFLWKTNRKAAVYVAVIGLTTAIILHLGFYLSSEAYQPLHLLGRGKANVGLPLILTGGVATVLLGFMALKMYKPVFQSMFFWYSLCLLIPFSAIAAGEFLAVDSSFARWEGANYLLPALPSVVFSWCVLFSQEKQ